MFFVPLSEIRGKNKFALMRFLCRYESLCVQFSAILKKNISGAYAVYINESFQDLYGIFCVKKTIFHLLPFVKSGSEIALQDDFVESFVNFYKSGNFKNPLCVNGTKNGTSLILKCFEKMNFLPAQVNDYNLLKLENKEFLLNLKKQPPQTLQTGKFQIIHCKKDMQNDEKLRLLELQKSYEQEEVVPECFNFDEDFCRLRFFNSLRTQFVLALKNEENQFVAKAGTNAMGFKFVQLGGIFTQKDCRGRHFAKYLLQVLLFRLLKIHKSVVLFVKKQNFPANKLYNSLSFKKISDYSIAYFKQNL